MQLQYFVIPLVWCILDALNFPYPQIHGLFKSFIRNSSTLKHQGHATPKNSRTFQVCADHVYNVTVTRAKHYIQSHIQSRTYRGSIEPFIPDLMKPSSYWGRRTNPTNQPVTSWFVQLWTNTKIKEQIT